MNKITVIAAAAAVLAVAGWITGLNIKIYKMKADGLELTAEIARKDARIARAEAAILNHNEALERLRVEGEDTAQALKNEYDRLAKKYDLTLKKTARSLGPSPGCEERLKAIYEAQEAFCYER